MENFISFELQFRCDGCIAHGFNHTTDFLEEEEGEEEEFRSLGGKGGAEQEGRPDYCTCHLMETLIFKDTYRFLSSPLASLTDALRTKIKPAHCLSCENNNNNDVSCSQCANKSDAKTVFPNTFKFISETYGEQHLDLLLQKQIYPYSYITSWEVLRETELPPKTAFFNR